MTDARVPILYFISILCFIGLVIIAVFGTVEYFQHKLHVESEPNDALYWVDIRLPDGKAIYAYDTVSNAVIVGDEVRVETLDGNEIIFLVKDGVVQIGKYKPKSVRLRK